MPSESPSEPDLYELLQISPNAEPETIHRVYRLLAQRYHPDNQQTGEPQRFRKLTEAYGVLSDPEQRARYDLDYAQARQLRWHAAIPTPGVDPIEVEQGVRLTVLEVLYERRRAEPAKPGVFVLELEELTGQPREHLEFTMWYLVRKNYVGREDGSKLSITVEGVDYLEAQRLAITARRRLDPHAQAT